MQSNRYCDTKLNKYDVSIYFQITCSNEKPYSNAEVRIVWASIEIHETSFTKLINFKFNEQGKFGNQQTKEQLTNLVSNSKKICSFYTKREGVFEENVWICQFLLLLFSRNWRSQYTLCDWQYLKTGQIKRNNDNTYSRLNSMNFSTRKYKIENHTSSQFYYLVIIM